MNKDFFKWDNLKRYLLPGMACILLFLISFGASDVGSGILAYWLLFFAVFVFLLATHDGALFGKKAKDGLDLKFGIALLVFVVFGCINRFYVDGFGDFVSGLILVIGLLSAFGVGYLLRDSKAFKAKWAFYAIICGLGLLVAVNLIANLASYPIFYTVLSSNSVYFYEGIPHVIGNESQYLYNFVLTPVEIDFAVAPAVVLASSLGTLFFMDGKLKEKGNTMAKVEFGVVAAMGLLGLLFLIFMAEKKGLFFAILVLIVCLVYRLYKAKEKPAKWVLRGFWIVVALGLALILFVILNALYGFSFVANSTLLNKIFNTNGYITAINQTVSALFNGGQYGSASTSQVLLSLLFGVYNGGYTTYGVTSPVVVTNINNFAFEFEILLEGGFIPFIALIVLIIFGIASVRRYFIRGRDDYGKVGLAILLLGIFVTMSFFYTSEPFAVTRFSSSDYLMPLANSFWPLIALFILGFTYSPVRKEEEEPVREEVPATEVKQ